MSDRPDDPERGAGEPKPPKKKAEDNPWYLLATLYGVPTTWDVELRAKNRVAWNRYFAENLDEETRTKLVEEKRHLAEELTPFSPDELREVQTAFAERCKASAKKLALPASDGDIDFSNVKFEQDVFFGGYLVSRRPSFRSATSRRALFGSATSGRALFDGATFSGDACFEGATFAGGATFGGATFSSLANFHVTFFAGADFGGATFSGDAHFSGVTFFGRATFGGATFSAMADFAAATFPGDARFHGATFAGGATFVGATFSSWADFHATFFAARADFGGATFSGDVHFVGAAFGDASFHGAAFGHAFFHGATFARAVFGGATFSDWASFRGAAFSGMAHFGGATFSDMADFDGAKFQTSSSFVNAEMKNTTSFEGAIFKTEPPKFFGAKLHQGTVWRGIKWPPKPKDNKEAGAFIDAYACLKLEMDRLKKHDDELDFFALELQSRRIEQGPVWGFPFAIYGVLSGYGRSYLRPLGALFVVVATGAVAFWRFDARSFAEALGLSAANTLNVFGFRRDFNLAIDDTPFAWLKVFAAGQTIFGTILLFLFGLGIRNKFRMK
ncbi:MAG TPA: pentapeptide repeat-containing protein [Methylocella sp.]|nr:pentapeptide repeat-containing protein [Methylocella sp.]